MVIKVSEAEDKDLRRLFTVASLAFGNDQPFWNVSWPEHDTEAGRDTGGERFIKTKTTDRTTTFMKAVDDSTNEIVGMAKWNIYNNHIPDFSKPADGKEEEYWNNADDRECQQYLSKQFFAERRDAIAMSSGKLVCLDILAVDPAYQRRGVGAALVEWGTTKADELGFEAVVESSKFGKGLYEKHGFVYTKQVELQVPQKWARFEGQEFAWLIRPRKGS